MIYLPYGNKKTVPNRKVRKSDRNKIFQTNRKARLLLKKKTRLEAAEAA